MNWQILNAHERFDERGIAKARAEGRKWNMDDMAHLGPAWWGRDRRLNPLHATRLRAVIIGGWLILVPLLELWAFVSGPSEMVPKSAVELLLVIAFLPGVAALFYGFAMPRFFQGQSWRLALDRDGLTYRPSSYWEPLVGAPEGWTVPLDAVARVETGSTSDWQPMRRVLLREKPVPHEEVQVFLFMADGSRRVIATAHGGRESMSTLAHSIRFSLQGMRERTAASRGASFRMGEGFRV